MTSVPIANLGELARCRSIAALENSGGYTIAEAEERFWRERAVETVLRLTAVVLILAGYLQWFLPHAMLFGNPVVVQSVLTAMCVGTGVTLYFFASRGFRRALRVDIDGQQIGTARLNTKGRSLTARAVPMRRIESLFINRPTKDQPLAELRARVSDESGSLSLMRGSAADIETLHRRLCLDIRLTLATATIQPSRVKPTSGEVERLFRSSRSAERQAV
ncbi:MAG: hypothetical protein QNJ44_03215 [Rhodobacter sp.]|nr:hypothetical protein [Rhodobacter sp.]